MQQQTVPTGFGASVSTPEQLYTKFLEDRAFDDTDIATLGLKLLNKDETKSLIGHTHEWSIQIPYFDIESKETAPKKSTPYFSNAVIKKVIGYPCYVR